MPIYEYQCEVCGHRFEVMQKFSDEPIKECVICSGPVRRVLSPPALVFKGSGWYATDYAGPERRKAMEGETKSAEASPENSGGERSAKTDTKADSGTSSE